jgi:hypothetical protein
MTSPVSKSATLARSVTLGVVISVAFAFVGVMAFFTFAGGEARGYALIFFFLLAGPTAAFGAVAGALSHWLRGSRVPETVRSPWWRRAAAGTIGALGVGVLASYALGLAARDSDSFLLVALIAPALLVGAALGLRADAIRGRARAPSLALLGLLATLPLAEYGWGLVQDQRPLPADLQRRWMADSLGYEKALAGWMRDSVILDSLAAAADRSAMVALYRQYETRDAQAMIQAEECESTRLMLRHGLQVAERITALAAQDVWPTEEERKAAARRLHGRVRESFFVESSEEACGPFPPRSGDTVAGVPVNYPPPRPWRPRRPRP